MYSYELRRDLLSRCVVARLCILMAAVKIAVIGAKLVLLLRGQIGKAHFLCSAPLDFFVGVGGFVPQSPLAETLKGALLLKLQAIRLHRLTSFLAERRLAGTSPFRV